MNKKQYLAHWEKLQEKMEWPEGLVKELNPFIDEVYKNEALAKRCEKLDKDLFKGTWDVPGLIKEAAEEFKVHPYKLLLFMAIYNSYRMKKKYIAHEWDMSVYYDSLTDIIVWATCCFKREHLWGLYEYGWVSLSLKCQLFKIGRFQYKLMKYKRDEYSCAGVTIKNGSTVIDMHIPEGESLTPEKRIDSYRRAYKFFNQTGNCVFVCHSWLFFKHHRDFLPETSNIIGFMNDFDYLFYDEGRDYSDLWRIFGFDYEGDNYPRNTGLQRGYADWLKEHGTTGGAYGIMIFDGEKILKKDNK